MSNFVRDENLELFLRTLYRESFTERPLTKDGRTPKVDSGTYDNQRGFCHYAFVKVKEIDGKDEKIPYKFATARTFQTLFSHMYHEDALWYTPNTSSTSKALSKYVLFTVDAEGKKTYIASTKETNFNEYPFYNKNIVQTNLIVKEQKGGRKEKYVRWLNALYVDIDNKTLTVEQIQEKIRLSFLPQPTVINETKRGYHVYWFFDKPVPAASSCVKLYKHVLKNIIMSLNGIMDVDSSCTDTCRYLQFPRNIVVADYTRLYSLQSFKFWLNNHGPHNYKKFGNAKRNKRPKGNSKIAEESNLHKAIKEPVTYLKFNGERKYRFLDEALPLLEGGVFDMRNVSCFALACCYKHKGLSQKEALAKCLSWNCLNADSASHSDREVEATVKSVYRSSQKGFPQRLVSELTGVPILSKYKNRKARKKRKWSHVNERASDVLIYLLKNYRLEGSQADIARELNMPLSTFKLILKSAREGKYKQFCIEVIGKGRNAVTIIVLNEFLRKSNPFAFFVDFFCIEEFDEELEKCANEDCYAPSGRGAPPF